MVSRPSSLQRGSLTLMGNQEISSFISELNLTPGLRGGEMTCTLTLLSHFRTHLQGSNLTLNSWTVARSPSNGRRSRGREHGYERRTKECPTMRITTSRESCI
uniref:Uncharacterized protein n=1 Tax=Cacopsylla melanoneura TaxID=428564 RepID=A0A8D9AP28_9HEMI